MNHSIYSADRTTHLKIVVVALVAGIVVAGVRHRATKLGKAGSADECVQFALPRGERPAMKKSIIWSIVGPGLVAHCAIICGWKNRIIAVQAHSEASCRSGTSNSPEAPP